MMIFPTDISQISSIIKKALYFFVFLASLITCKSQYHSEPVSSCTTDIPAAMLGKCIICAQREITGPLLFCVRVCLSAVATAAAAICSILHAACSIAHSLFSPFSPFSIFQSRSRSFSAGAHKPRHVELQQKSSSEKGSRRN